jgi:hypothetical protein
MNVLILVVRNNGCCVPIRRPDFTGQNRTGQDRTGQDRAGQDRTGSEKAEVKIIAFFYFPNYISIYKRRTNNNVKSTVLFNFFIYL